MKRFISLVLLLCLLTGCAPVAQPEQKQYTATFLNLFDTVTTITGLAESQEAFQTRVQQIHDRLLVYHQLFDIYHVYEGMANLKVLNDQAGGEPVAVDPAIIELLSDCKDYYALTGGMVNVAMGSVLQLWHEARNDSLNDPANAYLPEEAALKEAAEHRDLSCVIIDREAGTVQITDPLLRLDVGAVAKGWSVQKVCQQEAEGLLVSVGGNVCATGPKDETGTPWVVAIQSPTQPDSHLHTLWVTGGSIVTSGDYQRNFAVDGQLYHHIIHPDTLYPSTYWRSVSIVCDDSGLADALSTALFLLPQAEGQTILDEVGAMAMWVDHAGEIFYSPGVKKMIRS